MIRIGVAGAGLAGTLLAWRLAVGQPGWSVELIGPQPRPVDATAISGGLVRGFETDPESCRQAADSLAELHASQTLSASSGYEQTGSVYVCDRMSRHEAAGLVAIVEQRLPGSARLVSAAELRDHHGWAGLPPDSPAVVETRAGFYSPDRLRSAVLARLASLGVDVLEGTVYAIRRESGGGASCEVAGRLRHYDALVVAAGRWTPRLLAGSELPAAGFRTKAVEYAVYETQGQRPPAFIDDTSGLYGRPAADGRMILGVPSDRWEVDPDRQDPSEEAAGRAAAIAAIRFPRLRLTRRLSLVTAADCYAQPARLALRSVTNDDDGLYTFTGGSGGSAKTALAASREAARDLADRLSSQPITDAPAPASSGAGIAEAPSIARATLDDLDRLVPLFAAYLEFYGCSPEIATIRQFLGARMSRDESVVLLARARGAVAGFAQLYPTFSSLRLAPAWIANDLFVDPAFRGLGIARALCEHAIDLAIRSGASSIELQTARTNHSAHKLYHSLGFEPETKFQTWSLAGLGSARA